jgi:peroxiredoxin
MVAKFRCVAFGLILVLAGTVGWAGETLPVGKPAPDFSLQTLEGGTIHLAEAMGRRATLVVFWATWSPRSAEALVDFQALYASYGGEGLGVVAVNAENQAWGPADADGVQAVIRQHGLTFPVVVDKELSVYQAYGFSALPSTVLIDPTGTVVETLAGYPGRRLRTEFRDTVLQALRRARPEPVKSSDLPPAYEPKGKAGVHLKMGRLLFRKGSRDRGLALIQEAVAEDPGYVEAQQVLAMALKSLGRVEEAKRLEMRIASLGGRSF